MRYGIVALVVVAVMAWSEELNSTDMEAVGTETEQEITAPSNIEVIEVFRAETPEELEASLTDGYPMPWLAEILSDESIPEEDRYWLDCRIRGILAQQMHLFFDEEGNRTSINADFIVPGEDYWRENFIVNPITEDRTWDTPDMPLNMYGESGTIVNRFGEVIGNIALASRSVRLSRNGQQGIIASGGNDIIDHPGRESFGCFLSSDNRFNEILLGEKGMYAWDLSSDGSYAIFGCHHLASHTNREAYAALFCDGVLNAEIDLPCHYGIGPIAPAVSPEGRYVAIPLKAFGLGIYNSSLNELMTFHDNFIWILDLEFSPDGEFLCLSPQGYLLDSSTLEVIWDVPQTIPGARRIFRTSRSGLCSAVWETTLSNIEDETENLQKIYWNQTLIHETRGYPGEMGVSPNGCFVLQSSRSFLIFQEHSDQYTPFAFRMVREVR